MRIVGESIHLKPRILSIAPQPFKQAIKPGRGMMEWPVYYSGLECTQLIKWKMDLAAIVSRLLDRTRI